MTSKMQLDEKLVSESARNSDKGEWGVNSPHFAKWLDAYILTGSVNSAAKMAGVSANTAYGWAKYPEVIERIKSGTRTEMQGITYSLTQAALLGVNSLANIAMNGRSDETRIAAATTLIDRAAKFVESAEMAERLLALEQAFGPLVMHADDGTVPLELGPAVEEGTYTDASTETG